MALPFINRIRRSLSFWKERDQIIQDCQLGLYTVAETVKRLEEHAKPGGQERNHVFSCRNGYAKCRCPFLFDQKTLVPLAPHQTYVSDWVEVDGW